MALLFSEFPNFTTYKGMIILSIRRVILVLMILPEFASCRNDFELMATYKDIPVVYCVLNQNDSVHYLRLEKSFLGADNAYEMARQTDSIYYKEASVFLERWADGTMQEQLALERVVNPVRDSGIFTNDPNYLYQSTAPITGNCEYRLNIRIPPTGTEITASTHTANGFRIIKPETYKNNLPFSSYNNYLTVEWISAPFTRIYNLVIRFHYLEVFNTDTSHLTADWVIGDYVSESGIGGERLISEILQGNFYKWLGNKLKEPSSPILRLADKKAIDFIFTVGGEELYTYLEVYREDNSMLRDKP
ncbi:MAG: hypothetical protein NTV01_21475, partial [Bacteroidia bacterium]|nr:hypothetical protein [Bacteroidia bacterium]